MTPMTLLAEAPVERLGQSLDYEQARKCDVVVDAWIPD